jgi:hypothetical protein
MSPTPRPLPGGYSALVFDPPTTLLDEGHAALRASIVTVSDAAFGTPTSTRWEAKFRPSWLEPLSQFFVLFDSRGELVGWSGYRAATIRGDRVVYFTSTGLLPREQGHGIIPALQHVVVAREARRHPLRPVVTVVRTRNPCSYRLAARTFGTEPVVPPLDGPVPVRERPLVTEIARWLDFDRVDPASAIVADAYADGRLYGREPRSGDPVVDSRFAQLRPTDALLVLARRRWRSALGLTRCQCSAASSRRVPERPARRPAASRSNAASRPGR